MRRRPTTIPALIALTVLLAVTGRAAAEPHVRDGLYLGAGFGGGWASVVFEDDRQRAEWSGMVNARAGWAVRQTVLLGAEYARWSKDYEIARIEGDIPLTLTLSAVAPSVTYYPGNVGFKMRAAVGLGMASVEASPPAGADFVLDGKETTEGFAAMVAFGYEARVSTHMALGADMEFNYLSIDEIAESVMMYGLILQLNWYW